MDPLPPRCSQLTHKLHFFWVGWRVAGGVLSGSGMIGLALWRGNWGGAWQYGVETGEEVTGRVASHGASWLMTNWPGTRNFE